MNKSRNSRCRVTAVIPVARPDDRLARAIQSIEGQTVRPTELIIVLDGEGDVTPFLPLSAQVPVRVIKQKQAGAAAARNRGVAEASFEWIAFLDADDQWHPEKLQRFQEALDQFPETRLFASRFLELTEHASIARGVPRRCLVEPMTAFSIEVL